MGRAWWWGWLLALTWPGTAWASADMGCGRSLKLVHRSLGCDNLVLLSPGNDTRVNLTLLLLDQAPDRTPRPAEPLPKPLFEWESYRALFYPNAAFDELFAAGEGSRCRSNDSGAAVFEQAVRAARGLPKPERDKLVAARRALKPICAGPAQPLPPPDMRSRPGQAFGRYLEGAAAFYGGDFDTAAARFADLTAIDQPWLAETARYMAGRVELNRAQVGAFGEYGTLEDVGAAGRAALDRAQAAFRAYLERHPDGTYARSARGLLRRVYWLGGRADRLGREYTAAFAAYPAQGGPNAVELAEEVDDKLLLRLKPGEARDPLLVAVLDLARMRRGVGADSFYSECCGPPLTREELDGQRPLFAGREDLFGHLLATHAFYVANDSAAVLKLIPDEARQARFSAVQFSRQMLRGLALEARRDRNARGFWAEMLGGAREPHQRAALELAIAMHDERARALDRLFAPGSPVRTPTLRAVLLTDVAGPDLLRRQARDGAAPRKERDIALFTLLYKQLGRGRYADFGRDLALVPQDASTPPDPDDLDSYERARNAIWLRGPTGAYGCPAVRETAARLSRAPRAPRDLLCLADFFRVNGFDYEEGERRPPDELGGTAELFPGRRFVRLDVYRAVIADRRATAEQRAYALYRAVHCWAPAGINSCGGDAPLAQRKAWFQQLKTDYPASRWAKALRHYW